MMQGWLNRFKPQDLISAEELKLKLLKQKLNNMRRCLEDKILQWFHI